METHYPDRKQEDASVSSVDQPIKRVSDPIALERGLAHGHEEKVLLSEPEVAGGSARLARRSTGPQTAVGKSRSSKNALRHGIFASFLLPWESRKEFTKLVRDLNESFCPEGAHEEALVY